MGTRLLKQSTAVSVIVGPVIDYTDGYTLKTSLTVGNVTAGVIKGTTNSAITLTASGGNNDFVHVVGGHWSLELTTSNTDTLGPMRLHFFDADVMLPFWEEFMVVPAHVYDGLVAGSDNLQVDAVQILGTAVNAGATAGYMPSDLLLINNDSDDAVDLGAAIDNTNNYVNANIQMVSDDATAATNMEAMYDGTGYAGGTTRQRVDVQAIQGNAFAPTGLAAICVTSLSPVGAFFTVTDASFSPTTTQFEVTSGDTTDDHYNGAYVVWYTATNLFGARYQVTDYDGTNKRFTVDTMVSAPSNGDVFIIV